MSTETETTVISDAASSPASAPDPALSRSERRARQIAALQGTPKPAAATEAAPAEAPAASAEPQPGETQAAATARLDRVRAQIKKQAEERQARLAAQQRDQEHAQLRAELEQLRGRPSLDTFLEEFRQAPAAALRKYKLDPAQHLNLLTKDAITPGSVAAESQLEQLRAEFLTDKQQREFAEQQRFAAQQAAAYESERRAFAAHVETTMGEDGSTHAWPLLAKTPAARRIRLAVAKWAELQEEGVTAYDRDLVADAVEADLEELHQSWTPPASPPAAAQSAPPAAAPKKPTARTITPTLATESGAPRETPWPERKKQLAADMRRRNAAED